MKQITDLTKCPFCGHGVIEYCDSSLSDDNRNNCDDWVCAKCRQSWTIRYRAESVFYTVPDPDGVRDEIELGTVSDPQEG